MYSEVSHGPVEGFKPNLVLVLVFLQAGAQTAAAGGLRAPPCVHMADLQQRRAAGQLLRVRRRRGGQVQPSAEGRPHHRPLPGRSQVRERCLRHEAAAGNTVTGGSWCSNI